MLRLMARPVRAHASGVATRVTQRGCVRAVDEDDGPAMSFYHLVADATLDGVQEVLDEFADLHYPELETDCASGVLSFGMGAAHQFVLNKQAPNKQLWLSSPIRGPLRYDFDAAAASWVNNRDGHGLLPEMAQDMMQIGGKPIDFAPADAAVRAAIEAAR